MGVSEPATCTVIVTRPVGQADSLLRGVRRLGLAALSLPAVSLKATPDEAAARQALRHALRMDAMIFTSPAAVRFSARLGALRPTPACKVIAVGPGTARALERHGVKSVVVPARADSEGVLGLPELESPRAMDIALVGAPAGRNLIAPTLRRRGANMHDVHVYARVPARLTARHFDAVLQARKPLLITVTSAQALGVLARILPQAVWQRMLAGTAVVSSARLERIAAQAGFRNRIRAASASNADLIAAIGSFSVL